MLVALYNAVNVECVPLNFLAVLAAASSCTKPGGILSTKLTKYRFVHTVPAGVIVAAGFTIVPTFRRPHVTVLIGSTDDIPALLDALGPPQVNEKYGETRRRRRWTDDHR
jgi:hypothetical protein